MTPRIAQERLRGDTRMRDKAAAKSEHSECPRPLGQSLTAWPPGSIGFLTHAALPLYVCFERRF